MQQSRFITWSQYIYVFGLALGLIFIIPTPWFPLQLGKLALLTATLALAAILFILGGGLRLFFQKNAGSMGALLVGLLPLAYAASYYFSADRSVGLVGFGVESDTLLFMVVCALIYVLSFALHKTTFAVRVLLLGTGAAATVAVLWQYLIILFGTKLAPFAIFADRSVNVVGKWNDLGLLAGLLLVLLVLWLEFGGANIVRRAVGGIAVLAIMLFLAIVQFSLVWSLVLGFSLIIAFWSFVSMRGAGGDGRAWFTKVPWIPLAVALVSGLLLLWGGTKINPSVTSVFPVSSLEVRPSFSSTREIITAAHGGFVNRFLVGTGPQTFGQAWLLNKPMQVNQTPFWNLDFNIGFSTLMTAFGTVGAVGVLAWIIPVLLLLLAMTQIVRSAVFSATDKTLALALGVVSFYLWASIFFYVPSQGLIVLAFASAGAVLGFSMKHRASSVQDASGMRKFLIAAAAVVLVVVTMGSSVVVGRRFVAEMYTNQGLSALGEGNIAEALAFAEKSTAVEPTNNGLRLAVSAHGAKLQQLSQVEKPSAEMQTEFTQEVQKAITQGQQAIALSPRDYRGYFALGKVYDLLASLGVTGGYENAKKTYADAMLHNPKSPEIPLYVARLESRKGNVSGVEENLKQALTLKPDYTDAILFVVQLNVANKDIPNAIKAAQAAVRSAPGVPVIWFQLGLLYYSANDTANALQVFEQAVKLQADYANAKYFLGLSYAAQNRREDAMQQFIDLQKTNPDNTEIALILRNLQEGKPPFENAQPPVTPTPEDRPTAPISQ